MKVKAIFLETEGLLWQFHKRTLSVLQVVGASLFMGLCAQIHIPLFFTPVPFTFQIVALMFISATLGSKRASLALCLYLVEGAMGFPVWAGGLAGIHHLFGPTGGYLFSYPIIAYLMAKWLESKKAFSSLHTLKVLFFSCMLQLFLGSLWLSFFVGTKNMLLMGFYPFVLGDVIKALIVTKYLSFKNKKRSYGY